MIYKTKPNLGLEILEPKEKRKEHAEYMRKWRADNKERNLDYRREYYGKNVDHINALRRVAWLKKRNHINAERRLRHAENPEIQRAYDRLRWNLNKEKIRAKNRRSYHKHAKKRRACNAKYRREHPEVMKLWRKKNLDHLIEYNRAKRFPCAPYQYARKDRCARCGLSNVGSVKRYGRRLDVHHVDGDLMNNSPENLLTVCRKCHKRIEKIMIPVAE